MSNGEIGDRLTADARSAGAKSADARARGVRAHWEGFIDATASLRAELFQSALRLTGSPFDAEDLVHDALLRAFCASAVAFGKVLNQRAFLYRVLMNLWIDQCRQRAREVAAEDVADDIADSSDAEIVARVRDAAYVVFGILPPKERACLVLQDICGFSQDEIADLLSSTTGSVKVAVHRARRRVLTSDLSRFSPRASRVRAELVERFVEAMGGHDLEALKAVMVDSLEAEIFPCGAGVGFDHHKRDGWINGCFYHHIEWRERERVPYPLILETREIDGELVVLVQRDHNDGRGPFLEEVWRFEEEDGLIAKVRDYCFSPDLVEHVADTFDMPFRALGYRITDGTYTDPKP